MPYELKTRHSPQVTTHRVQLCALHALHTAPTATESSTPQAAAEGAAGLGRSDHKRHASWAQLAGMEDRISEALARQRFLRPRCASLGVG